ncbi:MAG: TetR/AcrR family transcriptional regulator [Clostridia bacterium]|nr:TetR/AcrR family transcriptional regulator [Clostridia bacterium]
MPPRSRITPEMIVEAGFQLIRAQGAQALSVRAVAAQLQCSTQPIMYHFSTVSDLTNAIYHRADRYHTAYLMRAEGNGMDPLLAIGLRYIRFAAEEGHLFRFLFQSDQFANHSLGELIGSTELAPIYAVLHEETGGSYEQLRSAFEGLFLAAHGYASLLANNAMTYEEADCARCLTQVFSGMLYAMKGADL